jgi:hypothetical protein
MYSFVSVANEGWAFRGHDVSSTSLGRTFGTLITGMWAVSMGGG